MDYLLSEKNTLIWLMFTIYAVTALFIVPNAIDCESSAIADNANNARALQFASRFIMRIALIFPMILLIKHTI
ncbi:hypothetical protein IQ255_22800 [Pleurocapsales cyanobacterium LEGE 10410]|nr:hypothetical protein [Pleurocapsales cyanobacterium LEGE 10410]